MVNAEADRRAKARVERDITRAEELWDSGVIDTDEIFRRIVGN